MAQTCLLSFLFRLLCSRELFVPPRLPVRGVSGVYPRLLGEVKLVVCLKPRRAKEL